IFLIILVVFSLNFVLGSIQISDIKNVYNLGDEIIATLTINPSSVAGNFEYSLNCGEDKETIIFYKGAENYFEVGKEIKLNTRIILDRQFIGNLSGECYLKVVLGSESFSSQKFKISNKIKVDTKLDKFFYNPGESIVLEINAIKENGEKFKGYVKISGIISLEKEIKEGYLKEVFITEKNQEAGNFNLEVFVYDLGRDNKYNNFETKKINLKINQVATSIPLTLSSLEIKPGEELIYQANLYDQSGKEMNGTINIDFVSPDKKKNIKRIIQSGSSESIKIALNETPGKWKIISSFGNIKEEREVRIVESPKLDFEFFENSSIVVIKNIGNGLFSGEVNFSIGTETRVLNLTIAPGEERRFTLTGPGEHDVRITAGEDSVEKRLLLTGKVIDVKEAKKYFVISDYPLVWFFISFLLISLVFVLFFRYRTDTNKLSISSKVRNRLYTKSNDFIVIKNEKNDAESSLVIEGTKEQSTFVVIKIKNNIEKNLREKIDKTIKELNKYSAAIEFKDNEILIIFSPKKTRSFKNEYNAIKYSYEISNFLNELNKKLSEKINYGIGINSGDIISKLEYGKLKYTNTDNSLSYGRKIANNFSNENVVISEKVKNKLLREIRTERIEKDGNTYYIVKRISDKEENEAKLKDLLNRINTSSYD
ncbi:MAG: hypothetical protein QXG18_01920, partial [Candidatus Pacearchaeota archaeon]